MVYSVEEDGAILEGDWTTFAAEGAKGTETASGGKKGTLVADYQVEGKGGNPYSGSLKITKLGENFLLNWDVGNQYDGIALRIGDKLISGWGIGGAYGVVKYTFAGDTAEGIWATGGGKARGMENLKKK